MSTVRGALQPLKPLWVKSRHSIVAVDVRYSPKSGHSAEQKACPLCANSGHCAASLDHLIGELLQGMWNRQAKRLGGLETRALGHGFVLDCTNDRREYGPASATRDQLGNHAANAQIARLCRRHDRRQS